MTPIDAAMVTTSTPGSAKVPLLAAVWASSTVTAVLSTATLGATLSTTRSKVVVVSAPSLSVAVIVTVWLSSGPSLVSKLQLQVSSKLPVIDPTEAVRMTVSSPTSSKVPLLFAVCASSTVTSALFAPTVGATFRTSTLRVLAAKVPSSSAAVPLMV